MKENRNRVSVVVSTVGRASYLPTLWNRLSNQTHTPHRVVFSISKSEDVPLDWQSAIGKNRDTLVARDLPQVILSRKGLTAQRNVGMEQVLEESDIVVFFDDDYVPSCRALEGIARAFDLYPELSGITGTLLADGARGPGIEPTIANAIVDEWDLDQGSKDCIVKPRQIATRRGLYGCNMAFRASSIGDIRFDERLPLYGWLEDIDFSSRIPDLKIVTDAVVGVHCGVKRGREMRGDMLGYSQIANPFYLWRKGSIRASFGLKLSMRNFLANHYRIFSPEPWIDRKGRAFGNWLAIRDVLLARATPEKVLSLN